MIVAVVYLIKPTTTTMIVSWGKYPYIQPCKIDIGSGGAAAGLARHTGEGVSKIISEGYIVLHNLPTENKCSITKMK